MKWPHSIVLTRMTTPLVHTEVQGDTIRWSVVDFDQMDGSHYRGQRIDVTDQRHKTWSLWFGWIFVAVWRLD